jgi:threonine synthase
MPQDSIACPRSLECSRCHHHISADTPQTLCPLCAGSLYVRYDMDALKRTARREASRPRRRIIHLASACGATPASCPT